MISGLSLWQLFYEYGGDPLLLALLPLYLVALSKGDPTDRACAHVLAIGIVLFVLLALDRRNTLPSWPYGAGQVVGDVLLLAALTAIAVHSSHRYPLIMAAAQLLIVLAGTLAAAGLIAHEGTLAAMLGAAALIQLAALGFGLVYSRMRHPRKAIAPVFAG